MELVARSVTRQAAEAIGEARIVLLSGPRQSGKTVLAAELHRRLGGTFLSLDDVQQRAAARADPVGLLAEAVRPVFIDEVQRGGDDLVIAIKHVVDRDNARGQFVLTGSTNFLTIPTLSESLAGRMDIVRVLPFSQVEIAGQGEAHLDATFLDLAVTDPDALRTGPVGPNNRMEYVERILQGGFPEAVARRSLAGRSRWFASYADEIVQRDADELGSRRRWPVVRRALDLAASLSAQELNRASFGRDLGADDRTTVICLDVLTSAHLLRPLPAWAANLTTRVKHRPKIHLVDSGLVAALRGDSGSALAAPSSTSLGPLLETFVVTELDRMATSAGQTVRLSHFRNRDGAEVDIVLEGPGGLIVGIEVKATATVRAEDWRWLTLLRERLGDRFLHGFVLTLAPERRAISDRLSALPVSALWA